MAREKYRPELNYDNLSNPVYWVEWVDSEGEVRHCLRSLIGILPEGTKIIYPSPQTSPEKGHNR
jgi:hypothetical protein